MAQNQRNDKSGKMSVQEAGKMGGEKTAATHGREFYQEIGAEGGNKRAQDDDVKSGELGRMGAEARWGRDGAQDE